MRSIAKLGSLARLGTWLLILLNPLVFGACEKQPGEVAKPVAGKTTANISVLEERVVEAGCGQCQFGLKGDGCDLAIRVDGNAYWVDGTEIDDHGDAHAEDGFCNAIIPAKVSGNIHGDRVEASAFERVTDLKGAAH